MWVTSWHESIDPTITQLATYPTWMPFHTNCVYYTSLKFCNVLGRLQNNLDLKFGLRILQWKCAGTISYTGAVFNGTGNTIISCGNILTTQG